MKIQAALATGMVLCLSATACNVREEPIRQGPDAEAMMKKQIELHVAMADLLEQVSNRRTYKEALPVVEEMRKASENLDEQLGKLPSKDTAFLKERFGKEFQAVRERLAKAEAMSRERIHSELPDLKSPTK